MRRKRLTTLFTTYYQDLLKAISSDNYDSLEYLLEETLLLELAAKIFDYEKKRGIQFRITPSAQIDIQVINHFYVHNMGIQRKENPSLKEYKMVPKGKNLIEYQPKSEQENDALDITVLENLEFFKKYYQTDQGKETKETSNKQEVKRLQQENIDIIEAQERNKFENSTQVQKETLKAFKEVMQHEYRLVSLYKPDSLDINMEAFLEEKRQKEKQTQLNIDTKLLNQDASYLEQVKNEGSKNMEFKEMASFKLFTVYLEEQQQKSDLFMFMKIFCPKLYNKYIKINNKDQNQTNQYEKEIQSANVTLSKIQTSNKMTSKFGSFIKKFFSSKKDQQKQTFKELEVFDVLIKSKHRLQPFHLKSGSEYLCNPELSDYIQKTQLKFSPIGGIQNEDSVYVMEVDKSIYDLTHPEYTQVHCFRFEIDRSSGKGGQVKITDIDFYLDGNRHAQAKTDDLFQNKSIKSQ